jgi:hypothetical protein
MRSAAKITYHDESSCKFLNISALTNLHCSLTLSCDVIWLFDYVVPMLYIYYEKQHCLYVVSKKILMFVCL